MIELDSYYTHFKFQQIVSTNGNVIGVAHFTKERPNYPKTAIVKVTPFDHSARAEVMSTIRFMNFKNIVQIYAYYRTSYNIVLFVEHCENGSLDKYLERLAIERVAIPAPKLLAMMLDISQALDQLHTYGAAHRDIKPHNVFVTRDLTCKLGDLETLKKMKRGEERKLQSRFVGTVEYMAPEKRLRFSTEELNQPTLNRDMFSEDLWALGKTFYEMCIGQVETADKFIPEEKEAANSRILRELRVRSYPLDLADLIISLLFDAGHNTAREVVTNLQRIFQNPQNLTGSTSPTRRLNTTRSSESPSQCALCITCRPSGSEVLALPGKCHSVCTSCLLSYLDTCTKRGQFSDCIGCPVCLRPIPSEFIEELAGVTPAIVSYVAMMKSIAGENKCPCGEESFSKVVHHGPPEPYLFRCKYEGLKLCSWCMKPKGHKKLFGRKKCSKFPFYEEIKKWTKK